MTPERKSLMVRLTVLFACISSIGATIVFKYSDFPNTATLADTDLFLIADPGVTNKNITWAQLRTVIGTNSAWSSATNLFSGVSFVLEQSSSISTSTNIYLNSVTGTLGSTTSYGELNIIATGDISITNATSINASDQVKSRLVPSGTFVKIAIEVQPGLYTNMAITQFK